MFRKVERKTKKREKEREGGKEKEGKRKQQTWCLVAAALCPRQPAAKETHFINLSLGIEEKVSLK